MKKKTLSILLTVAMMFSLISLPQAAAAGETTVRPGGDYTFEFTDGREITGGSRNVTVQDGKLIKGINEAVGERNLKAILNYRLESNKTYAYEVVGTLDNYTTGQIYPYLATATETVVKTTLVNMYQTGNGWYAPKNGDIKYYGKFTTGELTDDDYLAFYINDGTVGSEFKFDKVKIFEVRSGDQIFNFNNDYDVFRTVNAKADTQKGILALNNNTGADAELSATLNYQLKSNTAYSVEISFYVEGESTPNWITPKLYTSNPFTGNAVKELASIGGFGATPGSGVIKYYNKKISFTTGEISESENLLRFYMWVGKSYTYTYNINSIKIYDETEYPVNTGDYTFDFDVRKKDTVNVTNGYVADGKLVTKDGKETWDNLSAILNYKLQSNKTYRYEIVGDISGYTAGSVQAFLTLASETAADTAESGKIINLYYPTVISGWKVPTNGSFTLAGKFNTADLTDENNYLALYLNDGTDAKFEFDTIEIIEMNETAAPSNKLEVTSATSRKIILNSIEGCEYSHNGKVWQDSPVMTGYGTGEITFYARFKETKYNFASEPIIVKYTVHKSGDVNGDGEIAASDLSALKKYLLGISVYASPTGSDANEDEVLDIRDLVRLKNRLAAAPASLSIGNAEYTLDYSEEFFGTKLSSSWKNVTSYEKKINEKRSLVDNINNSVSNGVLSIGSSLDESGVYHGGEIVSADKFSHGYFEAKIKIPAGTGYFPAFWGKMPAFLSDKPYQNEIDFFEFFGTDREFYPGIHTWFDPNAQNLPNWIVNRDETLTMVNDTEFVFALPYTSYELSDSSIYHTYGCEWTSEKLAFYLDGKLLVEKKFGGDKSDYYTALREGDPIYIYLSNFVGYENTLPENIGYSLDVEYFRYYKPANS